MGIQIQLLVLMHIVTSYLILYTKRGWSVKQKYFDTFTLKKWEKMIVADRKKHIVSKCYAYSMQFTEIQCSFPLEPLFQVSIVNPQLCSFLEDAAVVYEKEIFMHPNNM